MHYTCYKAIKQQQNALIELQRLIRVALMLRQLEVFVNSLISVNAIKEIDRIIEKKEKLGDSTNYKSYEQLGIYYRNTISRYKLNQLVYV